MRLSLKPSKALFLCVKNGSGDSFFVDWPIEPEQAPEILLCPYCSRNHEVLSIQAAAKKGVLYVDRARDTGFGIPNGELLEALR